MTGCIAGPAFNLMIGLGATTLMCNLQSDSPITFDIHNSQGLSTFATLVSTMVALLTLLWVVWVNDFKIGKSQAGLLTTIYTISIVFIAVISL